jgi:hypothetical protein
MNNRNDRRYPSDVSEYWHSLPISDRRGGCLTLFLIVFIALSVFWIFQTLILSSNATIDTPATTIAIALTCQVGVIACAVALWNMKKWGFYGMLLNYCAVFVIGIISGNLITAGGVALGAALLLTIMAEKVNELD